MARRPQISKSLREEIRQLVGGRCRICGKQLKKSELHVGHVRAHSKGGSADIKNLLPTCRDCNLTLKDSNSKRIKKILKIGVWGDEQIRRKTKLGNELQELVRKRKKKNVSRRKSKKK